MKEMEYSRIELDFSSRRIEEYNIVGLDQGEEDDDTVILLFRKVKSEDE